MRDWLDPIRAALENAEHRVAFFFRADDVGWDDDGLWRFLDVFLQHSLPVDLAVIPNELTAALAHRLLALVESRQCEIGLHQHGFAHVNHETIARKNEFGESRPRRLQLHDIAEGKKQLAGLLGTSVDSIFTPPWNRCTRTTGECLAELGFRVLSRESRAAPLSVSGLAELPVSIDWFAHRKGIRLSKSGFVDLVATDIRNGGPVGIMFHHAVMNDSERDAAAAVLKVIAQHPMAAPCSMGALCGVSAPTARSLR